MSPQITAGPGSSVLAGAGSLYLGVAFEGSESRWIRVCLDKGVFVNMERPLSSRRDHLGRGPGVRTWLPGFAQEE